MLIVVLVFFDFCVWFDLVVSWYFWVLGFGGWWDWVLWVGWVWLVVLRWIGAVGVWWCDLVADFGWLGVC